MAAYLSADDYETYGLATTTADADVVTASALLNAYLGRPEGLIWTADADGRPVCMAAKAPTLTLKCISAVALGRGVQVNLPYTIDHSYVGEVVILDRASEVLREACVVTAIDGDCITLASVRYNHAADVTLETGLLIRERLTFGFAKAAAFLSRTPVTCILSICTRRDARDRRGPALSDANHLAHGGNDYGQGCVAELVSMTNPAAVSFIAPGDYVLNPASGELALHVLSRNLDTRVSYLSGFPEGGLPDFVKIACAQIVTAMQDTEDLPGNARIYQAGDTKIEQFTSSAVSDDIQMMLSPLKATRGL